MISTRVPKFALVVKCVYVKREPSQSRRWAYKISVYDVSGSAMGAPKVFDCNKRNESCASGKLNGYNRYDPRLTVAAAICVGTWIPVTQIFLSTLNVTEQSSTFVFKQSVCCTIDLRQ